MALSLADLCAKGECPEKAETKPASHFTRMILSKVKQLLGIMPNDFALCRPGGYGGAAAPDPIPNSAVKRSSANGTSSQDAGE